jgi:hypothetical protein
MAFPVGSIACAASCGSGFAEARARALGRGTRIRFARIDRAWQIGCNTKGKVINRKRRASFRHWRICARLRLVRRN